MASKRAIRRRSCVNKRKFATVEEARKVAKAWVGLEPYRCHFCGGYHLGHHPADNRPDSKKVAGRDHLKPRR